MTALVTPFKDGRVDEESFRSLIDWQIRSGTDVLVPCGTTGEVATLSYEEHLRVVTIAVEQAGGRVPVVAGTGSNDTQKAIKLARQAKTAGADGHLSVTPFYNKPPQEGLYQHFKAIAAVVDLPMVLYNVPGRTAVNMLPETVARVAKIDLVVGIKEAAGNMDQVRKLVELCPESFAIISGEDALNADIYKAGGKGCISVTANVAPDKVAAVWDAFAGGEGKRATTLHEELAALTAAMFIDTNPIPAKTALALMGKCREEFRLPLVPIGDDNREKLRAILAQYRLL
ncbi:MAG: 4-hydroxy-tetrahydrodipicolinate synthase [Deltaproteobacteria bacterium]|nr:4-hydroxy-tetrahydrodipicolinate synthase [Deltaproteobacteria bacterium]